MPFQPSKADHDRCQRERQVMLGVGLSLPEVASRLRGEPSPPTAGITTVVIEGDSISSTMPSTPNGSYSYQYGDHRSDKTIQVRAQNSRSVGTAANLNDDGNTLIGNVTEDLSYGPQLITVMIGANDFTAIGDSTYRANLIAYFGALKAADPAVKLAWSGPIAYNPTGTPHPSKAHFDAQRASLYAVARDPAVWSQWADYYLPLGELPDFGDADLAAPLFGDTVHPSSGGQALLYSGYRSAVDTILDPARAVSTRMYDAAWPGSETALATGTEIVRRFIVSGLAPTGTVLGISVSGGGAQLRLNGGSYGNSHGTGSGNGHRLYNGDVIDLKLTTSADQSTAIEVALTVGSETRSLRFTTAANVPATSLVASGMLDIVSPGTAHVAPAVTPPALGVAVIAVSGRAMPTGVAYRGVSATLRVSKAADNVTAVYTVPVADLDPGDLVVTYSASQAKSVVWLGVVEHADGTPTAVHSPGQDPNTIPTWTIAGITVPAKGIAIGVMSEYGGSGAPTGSVTAGTQVFEGYGTLQNGDKLGILIGKRASSGSLVFNYNGYQNQPMVALVLKAAGT